MPKYNVSIKTISEAKIEITANNIMEAMIEARNQVSDVRCGFLQQEIYFDEVVVKTIDTER